MGFKATFSDVTCLSWRLKFQTTRTFLWQLIQANNKETYVFPPLQGETTGDRDRWVLRTRSQKRGNASTLCHITIFTCCPQMTVIYRIHSYLAKQYTYSGTRGDVLKWYCQGERIEFRLLGSFSEKTILTIFNEPAYIHVRPPDHWSARWKRQFIQLQEYIGRIWMR